MEKRKYSAKRRYTRFDAEPNTLVHFHNVDGASKDTITAIGLVYSESKSGFATIMVSAHAPIPGDICFVKVGKLAILKAKVVWRDDLDADTVKLGFEYLE